MGISRPDAAELSTFRDSGPVCAAMRGIGEGAAGKRNRSRSFLHKKHRREPRPKARERSSGASATLGSASSLRQAIAYLSTITTLHVHSYTAPDTRSHFYNIRQPPYTLSVSLNRLLNASKSAAHPLSSLQDLRMPLTRHHGLATERPDASPVTIIQLLLKRPQNTTHP